MGQIDHVRVNKNTGIATVGGGAIFDKVINATYAAGREMSKSNDDLDLSHLSAFNKA